MQKVCIVIPCYNEEKRLAVSEFKDFFNQFEFISFCFVNDGSSDNTFAILNDLSKGNESRIKIIHLDHNRGKAEAIRQAIHDCLLWKNFEHIGYFDADFSAPLTQINTLLMALEESPPNLIAFGARVKLLGRLIERKPMRHYFGRVFSTFASMILNLPIYDTQCGAKIMKSTLAAEIFEQKFISPWLFDIELFARIRNIYGKQKCEALMIEVPLTRWVDKGDSRLKLGHMMKIPYELFRIFLFYRK